ncbi:hypothetical protein [Henriciella marina]|uniref:hypothetical protein n=1 Tax=Henriciella marina TaxID=453851 RepID=UPI000379C0C9|nr:hypothetical protein [Henriciella marina]
MLPEITKKELRREADFRRLKSRHPICLWCAFNAHPAALEFAHLIPSKFAIGTGGALCSNCHRISTEKEKDMSFRPKTQDPDRETIGRYLDALADWLLQIAKTLKAFGQSLIEEAEQARLDEKEADQ